MSCRSKIAKKSKKFYKKECLWSFSCFNTLKFPDESETLNFEMNKKRKRELENLLESHIEAVRKFIFDMNMRTGRVFEPFEGKDKLAPDGVADFCGQSSWGPVKFQIKTISH